jgi:hypothetical protein
MNISIETRHLIDQMIASGQFTTPEQVIEEAVRCLDLGLRNDVQIGPNQSSPATWCEEFEQWARSHRPSDQEADDTREAIYQGRGE